MPGSAPGISGAESGLAPDPPPEADGDMRRDAVRLLEAASPGAVNAVLAMLRAMETGQSSGGGTDSGATVRHPTL